ncbi:MAG: 23S rRNA (pseudouridine(1915)-N(3))-methyltransferase RlmH [Bacilli bacterium]|jgi:23S rRNA (pseudouridine1915-N3)-methyltransferase|nr:23S rRNA (pseudouridine(1915)-N(3))-methyltransferase RlmH [Bacilli bacterium]MDD4006040.1 23S rRNA (pseudouridine(1915)-N(3))-methyltransferase RlmH [Bacilli bacterium]
MKIKIIAVGSIKEEYWRVALEEYKNRLSLYTKIEIIEVKDEPAPSQMSKTLQEKVKLKEGTKILHKIKDKDLVVAVDLNGPQRDSETFAKFIDSLFVRGNSEIVFVIGGSLGLSPEVQKRANEVVTLSKLTFTHQMTRVIVLEQIYRAFKINRNETYHK